MVKFIHVVTALIQRSNAWRLLYAVPRDRNRPIRQEVLVSRVESRRRGLTLSGSLKESWNCNAVILKAWKRRSESVARGYARSRNITTKTKSDFGNMEWLEWQSEQKYPDKSAVFCCGRLPWPESDWSWKWTEQIRRKLVKQQIRSSLHGIVVL